jgi:hypothetical protein
VQPTRQLEDNLFVFFSAGLALAAAGLLQHEVDFFSWSAVLRSIMILVGS